MLTSLRLQNFKSWKDTDDVRLRPITGLFGTNSSGKSSLIQAMLLLKQTAEYPGRRGPVFHFGSGDSRSYVDLGDFESVVHNHDAGSTMSVSLDWKNDTPLEIWGSVTEPRITRSDDLGFCVATRFDNSGLRSSLVVDRMSYKVGEASFGMRRERDGSYQAFAEGADFEFRPTAEWSHGIASPLKFYGFPDEVHYNYLNTRFLADLEFELALLLGGVGLNYLGPLRARPERSYSWSDAYPTDIGRSGEFAVEAILAARDQGQMIGRGSGRPRLSLEEYAAQWLKDLGLIHDFRVERVAEGSRLFEVKLRKSPNSAEVLLPDVGFGVSQVLPAIVLCSLVPEGSTVILEQPEIHLHPSAQAGLADVFVDAWRRRKVQVIVESHSEHLLRRLQRRIAEEKIPQEDVGLFFCSPGDEASRLEELEVDPFGNIANWPKDFFGDQFGEIASMSEAGLKRQVSG